MTLKMLTELNIISMNKMLISRQTPDEISGIRDPGALNMTIQQLNQEIFGRELYPTLEEKSALLIMNLIKKHPFHNGNKRTAFMALTVLLGLNGYEIHMEKDEVIKLSVGIATCSNENFSNLKEHVVELIAARMVAKPNKRI